MYFVEIGDEFLGLRGCQFPLRVDGEVWVIALVGVEWGNSDSCAWSVVISELREWK